MRLNQISQILHDFSSSISSMHQKLCGAELTESQINKNVQRSASKNRISYFEAGNKWPVQYTSEPVIIMIVYDAKLRVETYVTIEVEVKNRTRGIRLRYYMLNISCSILTIFSAILRVEKV